MDSKERSSNKENFISRFWPFLVLAVFLVFFAIQNNYYLKNNTAPPYADTTHHLMLARQYHRALVENNFHLRGAPLAQKYPPLIYLNATFFLTIFGVSIKNALWSYFPFIIIYLLALYGIGSYFGNKVGGVAVALIGMSTHFMMYMARMFVPELPQSAMTTLAFYFLLKSERFTNRRYSYIFGVTVALAMLTKWSSAFYLAAPILILLCYLSFRSFKTFLILLIPSIVLTGLGILYIDTGIKLFQKHPGGGFPAPPWAVPVFAISILLLIAATFLLERRLLDRVGEKHRGAAHSLLLGGRALLIGLLIFGVWYVYNIQGMVIKLDFQRQEIFDPIYPREDNVFVLSMKQYLSSTNIFPMPCFVLALVGVIFAAVRRKNILEFVMLGAMGLSGFLLVSALAPPSIFYILTLFTLISVMAGYWFEYAWKFKYVLLPLVIIFSIVSVLFPLTRLTERDVIAFNRNAFDLGLGFMPQIMAETHNYHCEDIIHDLDVESRKEHHKGEPGSRRNGNGRDRLPDIQKYSEIEGPSPVGGMGQSIPVGILLTDEFRRRREDNRSFVEREVFPCLITYNRMTRFFPFYFDREWRRRFNEFRDRDIFIIVGFVEPGYGEEAISKIKKEFGRNSEIISRYKVDKFRKLVLLRVKRTGR